MSNWVINYIIWQLIIKSVTTWHGFGNENFHCWPYDANSDNPTPFTECKGIKIKWIVEPPSEIKAEEHFNTTYELIIEPAFYTWGIGLDFFTQANITGISDAALAEQWCKDVICPAPSLSTPENCCVHHVNVHSCPLGETDTVQNGLCGPWIPPSGSVFTHSSVMVGPVGQGNWTSTVAGLYAVGETSVIAHFKLARMHIAIEKRVNVLPRTICGDGRCELSEGEECSSCPKDCAECPLEDWEIALIVTFIMIILIIFLVIIIYFRYQKRKLFWDESWIIPHEDIKEDNGLRGAFGSMLSIISGGSKQSGSVSSMATSAVRRQVFATTAFYDGRTVAVKRIKNSEFVLTKVIRTEVKTVREMDHPNLCKFIGGCIKVPNVCIVSEYCPKGSLNDVLLNDDIPLSWSFRFSFATDIARGVSYLHSRSLSHGRLTSSNCLVS
ncbi:atrial natriuretic peptide receptor 2 [Patella vulgata]|uniref:atrial natriuretic peptide receptor 2 n=1 Tax=Patella vulgata TaxID=6465 RepID=UPI0024A7F85D|nr:atrial natriuretic peptide receptor 2 [Patella vulgata]